MRAASMARAYRRWGISGRTACGIAIDYPIARQDVAEAGTMQHTASRTIAAWERGGILS
jgi:hypothetical protein